MFIPLPALFGRDLWVGGELVGQALYGLAVQLISALEAFLQVFLGDPLSPDESTVLPGNNDWKWVRWKIQVAVSLSGDHPRPIEDLGTLV